MAQLRTRIVDVTSACSAMRQQLQAARSVAAFTFFAQPSYNLTSHPHTRARTCARTLHEHEHQPLRSTVIERIDLRAKFKCSSAPHTTQGQTWST